MQNAIDFRELRRRERRRARSSKTGTKTRTDGGRTAGNPSTNDRRASSSPPPSPSPRQEAAAPGESDSGAPTSNESLAPYETLLREDLLSEARHRIGSLDSVLYARNFLPSIHVEEVLSWLRSIPDHRPRPSAASASGNRGSEREESARHNGRWTRLRHAGRRVALFDGTISGLPPVLRRLSATLVVAGAFPSSRPPNHVLVNEYRPGEGIMPHTDGPAYDSRTATISLGGSDVIFRLWPRRLHDEESHSAPIRPGGDRPSLEAILHGDGSLLLFTDDAYLNHCHEIREGILEETTGADGVCGNDPRGGTRVERGYRVSLTFRRKK